MMEDDGIIWDEIGHRYIYPDYNYIIPEKEEEDNDKGTGN